MQCPECSRSVGEGDRFCGGCGHRLALLCAQCGHDNEFGSRFCTRCGTRVADPASAPREDRRQVSVLFIDMVDFTRYAERTDPEQARLVQQGYFGTVRRLVQQYGGVVEKYIGDAVMALFGAPVATENDALRCVRAGLELQRLLTRQSTGTDPALRFRVGIASGEALVDLNAARDLGQAFVTGDVVNTAARLQSVAPPGGVLVDETTWAATQHDMEYTEQAAVTLRGRSSPSRVWLAERARPRSDRYVGELTPMVNREHERGLLVNALHRTIHERVPQLVTVFGPAGVGKSRLLRELSRHAASLPDTTVNWWVGHCPPFGENVTYAALAEIIKAWAGILDSDDESTARARLRERLDRLADAQATVQPAGPADPRACRLAALGPLVGVPGERLTPGELETAWRHFLLTLAAEGPTVLVFEDMHWADQPMLHFVEQLGATARELPLLIIATARPELRERQPAWTSTISGSISISVPPMHDSDIAMIYSLLLGQTAVSPESLDPLVELAGGNPLYAQEFTRMLLDGGLLDPKGRAAVPDPGERMPRTVQAVIANRLDLLSVDDRDALQAAAVVGRQFWPGAVAAALGRPVPWVRQALSRLEKRDLIYEQPLSAMANEPEYQFRHILVRDVCYQRLPRAERVARHHRTADWLEQVSEGRQTDLAEVLANHRWAAHEIARTVGIDPAPYAPAARDALRRAARRAYALQALDAARTLVDRAQSLNLPEDPGLDLFAAELALYQDRDAFLVDGGTRRLRDLAERLTVAGDRAGAAHAWTLLATAAWSRADRAETLACLDRATTLYAGLPDTEEKAMAVLELARVHMMNAETEQACRAARAAAELAERLRLSEVGANARITLAAARYMAGEAAAFAELTDVTEHCRAEQLVSRRRAMQNLAWALQEEGDLAGSTRLIDEQRSLDVGGGHSLSTSFADQFARSFYAGDWSTAVRAAAEQTRLPTAEWDLHIVAVAGWLRVLRGESRPAGACDEVLQAVAAARRSGFHRVLRAALAHAALCRALRGLVDEAVDLLRELDEDWRDTRMLAFAEWVAAAGHLAAVLGGESAVTVLRMLERVPRVTPWAQAAREMAAGSVAAAAGDLRAAGRHYARAADRYARMPARTDQMLASAFTAGVLTRVDPPAAARRLAEVRAFADRNRAPGLLRLAGADPSPRSAA